MSSLYWLVLPCRFWLQRGRDRPNQTADPRAGDSRDKEGTLAKLPGEAVGDPGRVGVIGLGHRQQLLTGRQLGIELFEFLPNEAVVVERVGAVVGAGSTR